MLKTPFCLFLQIKNKIMKYTKIQKFISSFIIFSLLFSITFRIPLFNYSAFAWDEDFYNLVSIIIDEETYDEIESEVKRYSKDISWVLENTKVVILPVPTDVKPFDISSMNESLYYDWYKWIKDVNFESKLIWTVLIWNIPLPLAFKKGESAKTILPFTDFEDKAYIFNESTWKYEFNSDNISWLTPEIWHGVISPNNWNFNLDIDSLKSYFDKNTDFYNWNGFYDYKKSVINWNISEWTLDSYDPYVFYFDNFRESKALNYNSFIWYEWYLNNKEDVTYNRFTKELAEKLKKEILGNSNEEIVELALKINPDLDKSIFEDIDSNLANTPDIQSRYIINNAIKNFIEVFSKWTIGELRKDVFNAWRYNNNENGVDVDFIPYIVSVLDIVNDQIIKDINDELEVEIDNLVENGLSRKIAIPTTYKYEDNNVINTYENYLFWKKASTIDWAVKCSYYRGSLENWWNLVESNRWLNIYNIESDKNSLSWIWQVCFTNLQSWASLNWLWGFNSPFNLNEEATWRGELKLDSSDYKWSIVDLYDIDGSKKITDINNTPNPYFCLENNYILADENVYYQEGWEEGISYWANRYTIPTFNNTTNFTKHPSYNSTKWSCLTDTNWRNYNDQSSFDEMFTTISPWFCEIKKINLDWKTVKDVSYVQQCTGWWDEWCQWECSWTITTTNPDGSTSDSSYNNWKTLIYNYKSVPSYIKHKSPTSTEISSEVNSMIAPSLAIDKNRYIDFINTDGDYNKINYPYLYRLKLEDVSDIDMDKISEELDKLLDKKSDEINDIINKSSNLSWDWDDNDFYNNINWKAITSRLKNNGEIKWLLSTWSYPSANFDLKWYLKNKWSKTIDIDWETKNVSYYDILVFSIYWNNLNSVSSKYWFVFENYLSDQIWSQEDFFLPKNKKLYEIAYLWSKWDASNMYIWLDPESKNSNPYSDIVSENQSLSTKLLWLNISWSSSAWSAFKCAPPEWVPIWEWIPAVMCRLWEMMPPTISFSDWACWPSLLSNDEKEELNQCNWDINKNGVNDCLETRLLEWTIELKADSDKYYYNSSIKLNAVLKWKDDKKLSYINATDVNFDIVKIETKLDDTKELTPNNLDVVYDIEDEFNSDRSIFNDYVVFKESNVRSTAWEANYWLSVKNKEANIYIKASVNVNDKDDFEVLNLTSNLLEIKVRGDRLFTSTYKFQNSDDWLIIESWEETVLANDNTNVYLLDWFKWDVDSISNLINNSSTSEEKLIIKLENISKAWKLSEISYPLNIKLVNNWELIEELNVSSSNFDHRDLFSLSKTWNYTIEIKDSYWSLSKKSFTVTPWEPSNLDLNLGTNILQIWWSVSTNFVTILDKFNNPVDWKFYDFKMSIDGDSLLFIDNDSDELNISTYEWYSIFRLKSTDEIGVDKLNIWLYDLEWNLLLSQNEKVSVFDEINITLKSQTWDYKVWWESHKLQLAIRDKDWNLINNFNSRVYMVIDSMYLDVAKPYFEVKSWVWIIEFKTKNISWSKIPVEFQIEWLNDILSSSIKILPSYPIKMDLVLTKSEMEASVDTFSSLSVELKDRYNNLVFNDDTTKASIEILKEYSHILKTNDNSQVVKWWKATFKIYWTVNPWIWYFKVSTNPSLSLNSFKIVDEKWELEINWVWENAWMIETFYVWNKSKIEKSNYNWLYTTLLGSNYWDIDQKNYLAWSVIFDENSKALAATSLINLPHALNNTLSISKKGWLQELFSKSDLSQDIETKIWFENNKLFINLYNWAINTFIWRINYNLWKDIELEVCNDDIVDCVSNNEETTIFWKSLNDNFSFYVEDKKLSFRDNLWKSYIDIDENWTFSRKSNVELIVDYNSTTDNLWINIKSGDDIIWYIGYDLLNSNINVTRDELVFENKTNSNTQWIYIYMNSSLYWSYTSWKWSELIIYYNDPFWSKDTVNNFSKGNLYWYENFENKKWLWWNEWNKTLLSFSSWKSVWESVKEYFSFSTINIWDPVISIKKIKKQFRDDDSKYKQFDSTIWDVIDNKEDTEDYRLLDYNADWLTDILLIKRDKYFELLENTSTSERFLNKWNLANVIDLWSNDLIKTWDYTWDWYQDIFFVWKDGKPYILNNINKDFSRLSLENKFDLDWAIIRAESFDMDNDGIDDIVSLDDAWQINIFYWWGVSANPVFTKLNISSDYWIKLNSTIRNDSSLVYFDWLHQIDSSYDNSSIIKNNENYLNSIQSNISNDIDPEVKDKIDTNLVNSFVFELIAYSKDENKIEEIVSDYNELLNLPETIEQTTFIKWEFSESAWVKVEKVLIDRNWEFLKAWDIVDVEIKVINKTWKTINNVAYIEDVLEYFTLNNDTLFNSKDLKAKKPNNAYEFIIDRFSLENNEDITITYSATVKPLKYWYLQVWLFEKDEDGDDRYGDIILKDSIENCWAPVEIFRSTSTRLYNKWIKNPSCDDSELPEAIEENNFDSDGDGIPDYIEKLTWSSEERKKYSEEKLSTMFEDSDWDGIPNDEDLFNSSESITVDLWWLGENIDAWLDNLQWLVNALSCWFNNWACFASPLNWAPLAPWGDPTFNGYPIWDWLKVWEWYPIFSSLTWNQTTCWTSPCCIPSVYPIHTQWFIPWPICGPDSAGGDLWIWAPTNTFRLFVTPTLTWWVWVAACFWWPAIVAWYSNMPGVSPLFPGWNCIVVAKPILWCSNDWSTGDPSSIWYPVYWNNFGVINWNCNWEEKENFIDTSYVNKYYDYVSWNWSSAWLSSVNEAISDHSSAWNGPLFGVSWNGTELSVSVDPDSWDVDFWDVTQFVQKRIQAFPWFLMNWVTRQIEEIVNKLTDFPTVFVILPDFSWIYDTDLDWETNKQNWLKNSWNKDNISDGINLDGDISSNINTDEIENDTLKWLAKDANELTSSINDKVKTYNSWIKEAYEFIWSLPLVKIEQEPVDIELPWISVSEIDKTIITRQATIDARKAEYKRAKEAWSLWGACEYEDSDKQKECEDNNAAWEKVTFEINWLINSLEANLEVIKEYKKTPEKINKLINKKQDYLEQILCNVEIISEVLWWRIWKNGERFKAWVELYILIKAILKSWQLLIDVFIDYEEECKECKNERQDLQTMEFELISMVVPDIPVIQFPKWPDIIIDLHNIRAWLNIALPEFNVVSKPILLPQLPDLYLPDVPNINIALNLPELPVLPLFEIPELPDLPSLPSIELPDLPPPPTLPKLFAELEAILDILKLITKAMCILKSSPFVPEWRAWDQIAFLTERNWYLPTDFLNISLPQFSFPFIDAIEVTTYVNFEFETDFIVELARQAVSPINSYTSDFTNLFNISTNDLDFRHIIPWEIDVNIGEDWISQNNKIWNLVASILEKNLLSGYKYISDNKEVTITNAEFKKEISKHLENEDFSWNPKLAKIKDTWDNVNNYTFSKENKIIKELKDNNFDKFELVKDIINTEIIKNKEFKNKINNNFDSPVIKVSLVKDSDIKNYNTQLEKYNSKVFENTSKLLNYDDNDWHKKDIKESWEALLTKVDNALWKYKSWWNGKLLSANKNLSWAVNSCSTSWNWENWYVYEWIYILEDNKSYRLFDYLWEITWDETTKIIDFDNDWDEDLLYFVNNTLYLKENLLNKSDSIYLNENASVIDIDDNRFINWDRYIQSVNNVFESNISSWIFNVSFKAVENINNYRLSFYTLVDKLLNEDNELYKPEFKKKSIIDWVSWIWTINLISNNADYVERSDIVTISNVWDLKWIEVITDELLNIKDNLNNWNVVVLSNWTYIYSWDSTLVLKYVTDWSDEIKNIVVPKNRNIEIKSTLNIVWITWNWYIKSWETITVSWVDIRWLVWKPLSIWTKISYIWNVFDVQDDTYIELKYYDNSELSLDFEYISDWELYDLWYTSKEYLYSIDRKNDYYYWVINWFSNDVLSTSSKQILISPQLKADNNSPELNMNSLRVPVYQELKIDITKNIYEDSGIDWVKDIYIDFDLENDSSWDWNNKNDNDSDILDNVNIEKQWDKIYLILWKFTEIFEKTIWFILTDNNDNIWYTEIWLESYSPNPSISNVTDTKVIGSINEKLTEEPINLYRYRWWTITKLSNEWWENLALSDKWEYSFNLWESSTWVTIHKDNEVIWYVDESTWKITLTNILYNIEVDESDNSSNDLIYPKITVKGPTEDIFYETIRVDWKKSVEYTENFEWIEDTWVYVQFLSNNYNYYIIPDTVWYNPWSMAVYRITDLNKEPLFTIFRDGRINTINWNYWLKYDYYDNYVVLKLFDKHFNREVASVLYKVNSDYIIK